MKNCHRAVHLVLALGMVFSPMLLQAQFGKKKKTTFTREDSLRGSVTPERAWWDMTHCALEVKVNPEKKTISGQNTITFKTLSEGQRMQLDLQEPMEIAGVVMGEKELEYEREGDVFFVEMEEVPGEGESGQLTVKFKGKPRIAKMPPWDGAFSWRKDKKGDYFIATSCQGMGASAWWPLKDHPYDEPDSLSIAITVPKKLQAVANGRLRSVVKNKDKTTTYTWAVTSPINAYGVNINIANYRDWTSTYEGEKGPLDCHFFVLKDNYDKAQEHFQQVDQMFEAFEHWFGPYPFYEDGYKLVEVPYLGMEHQSSVTYGNKYKMGYLGRDLSMTGYGLKFDYIIVHESGHEWFANNITHSDVADFWIHEGFTQYSEALFVEYHYGKEAGAEYVRGLRFSINNREPLISPYDVNETGSGDSYAKGANMLHTLRTVLNDDEAWREILRGINRDFYHQTVSSAQIEAYINARIPHYNAAKFFDQYLRDPRLPVFAYYRDGATLKYQYQGAVDGFDLPLRMKVGGEERVLNPGTEGWQEMDLGDAETTFEVNKDYYVRWLKVKKDPEEEKEGEG